MLQTIREKSQGPVLTFIVVSICLAFAATGVDSILGSSNIGSIATVNGEKVTQQELNESIYLQKRQLIAKMGENIDPSMLDDNKLKAPALESLIQKKVLLQLANENGMKISDVDISKMITQNPDFHKEGKFSYEYFESLLTGAGLTPALYKRLFVADVLLQQVTSGIIETGFITDKDIAIDAQFTHQTRDITYISLNFENEKAGIIASEADAKSFYEKNTEQFKSEESVIVDYIEINQSDFKADIDEKEIKSVYDLEVSNFNTSEQREVSHILIQIDADTDKVKATEILNSIGSKVKSGEDFAELAMSFSEDLGSKEAGGLLGVIDEASYPKEFIGAAKVLKVGEVSPIVETESGLHLIRLNSVNIPKMPSYDERKDAIKNELQLAKSAPLYIEALEQLKDSAFNSVDLSEPAQTLKLEIKTSAPILRNGGQGVFAQKAIYKKVYADNVFKNGENSDVIEISPTHALVLHLKEHRESRQIPFEDVIQKAKVALISAKARDQLSAKADSIKAELLINSDAEVVAKKHLGEIKQAIASLRANPDVDKEILELAFKLPKATNNQHSVEKLLKSNGDYVVVSVSNTKDGNVKDINPMESKTLKSYIPRMEASLDFNAFEESLKAKSEIHVVD